MRKDLRLKVYNKYDGRCAYCGKEIEYKDMQVDHILPKCRGHFYNSEYMKRAENLKGNSVDDFENLNPSCRRCNHYKRANSIEVFRRYISEIPRKLKSRYIYKVGLNYGLIQETNKEVKFYFENHSPVGNITGGK
jgi:hypothetical protein